MRRITNEEQDAAILAKAKPDAKLAAEFNLTKKQIVNRRFQLRTNNRKIKNIIPHYPKSRLAGKEAVIRELIAKGTWQPQMAKKLRVSLGTVAGFIRRRRLRRKLPRYDDPRYIVK